MDNLLLHRKPFKEHSYIVKHLALRRHHDFVLNPAKCNQLPKRAAWCGLQIRPKGIILDPQNIEGFLAMPKPTAAAGRSQFYEAINLICMAISN